MYAITQNPVNAPSVSSAMAVRNVGRFVAQLYFVLTDRCIECGKLMDEQASYGIRCMRCEGGVMR